MVRDRFWPFPRGGPGVEFQIRPWDPKMGEGTWMKSVWLKIRGFPKKLWLRHEFEKLVDSFGGVLLQMDKKTEVRYDYRGTHIRVAVCDYKHIPQGRLIRYKDGNNEWRKYQIQIVIKQSDGQNKPQGFGE